MFLVVTSGPIDTMTPLVGIALAFSGIIIVLPVPLQLRQVMPLRSAKAPSQYLQIPPSLFCPAWPLRSHSQLLKTPVSSQSLHSYPDLNLSIRIRILSSIASSPRTPATTKIIFSLRVTSSGRSGRLTNSGSTSMLIELFSSLCKASDNSDLCECV
jgi:hypothetical protein